MRIGVKPGQWGWAFDDLVAAWRIAEDAGFDLVGCFDHVTADEDGSPAWDAPTLLAAMSSVTERIRLALDVANVGLRHPFLLAGQVAVAQAASGGRVELGLGAGSGLSRLDHETLGIRVAPFATRVERLEAHCRLLPALWRGESVTDEAIGLRDAALGRLGIEPPPIAVGGKDERVLRVAVRFADRWNAVEADPAAYALLAARVDALCRELGRERPLARTVQVFDRAIDLGRARDLLPRFEEAGADTVTFALTEATTPDAVSRLAAAVL